MSRAVRGLMIKDFQLIKSQMRYFFIVVVVFGIIMSGSLNMSFFVGYVALLCAVLLLSTFAYDEYENGSRFLFTLPVSRRDYVFEKYVFGILLTTVPYTAVSVISWLVIAAKGSEMSLLEFFLPISVVLPMAYLLLALEIPLQIWFGREKSRVVTLIMVVGMSAGMGLVGYLNEPGEADPVQITSSIAGLGVGGAMALTAVILAALLVSYKISCAIIAKKEY